jgi:hypothetical protein
MSQKLEQPNMVHLTWEAKWTFVDGILRAVEDQGINGDLMELDELKKPS